MHVFFHTSKNSIAYMQYPYTIHSHATFPYIQKLYCIYIHIYAVLHICRAPPRMHGCLLICAHSKEIRRACAAMRLGWQSARAQLTEILGCGGTMLRPVNTIAYMQWMQ